jgi:putative transposase
MAMILIKEAYAAGASKRNACELLGVSIRTVERWTNEENTIDKRKNSARVVGNKLSEEEREHILLIANSEDYRDLPPCKIVPLLADQDKYIASESTFYRLLKEKKQLEHRGKSRPATHHKPEEFVATGPNQVWTWDITYLPTQVRGLYLYLYMIVDIYSRKIVGWSIHEEQTSEHASMLIAQACADEKVLQDQLVLHSDNGTPMKGVTMLTMLQTLGIVPSFSRPSVSNDNPYSEALFKTLKYIVAFVVLTQFSGPTDARIWAEKLVAWYNDAHLHSALKFITPNQRHSGTGHIILENRHRVYQLAREQHPERWSKNTRNWSLPATVTLNPNKKGNNIENKNLTEFKRSA